MPPPLRLANTGSLAPASPRSDSSGAAHDLGQQHLADLAALAQDVELHPSLVARQHVGPRQADQLGDAEAAGIGNLDEHTVALGACGPDQEADLDRGEDPLRKAGAAGGGMRPHLDGDAGVEGGVAELMGVAEQGFHPQHVLAGAGVGPFASASKSLSLVVAAPTITVTTTSLPGATFGSSYTAPALTASGGTSPYTFTATGLPNGLTLTNGYTAPPVVPLAAERGVEGAPRSLRWPAASSSAPLELSPA